MRAGLGGHYYSAAKAAAIHLTRCAAVELGEKGIRVNSLSPGMIATGAFGKYVGMQSDEADDNPEYAEAAIGSILPRWQPLPYVGRVDDIAQAALFLTSDASRFVTGHNLVVDGGISASGQRISVLPKENIVLVFTGGGSDTDQIAPFLFRAIRSDRAIPENHKSQQRLKQALLRASSPILEAPNTRVPKLAGRISGVSYSLSPNPLDLRELRLDFRKRNEATATLRFPTTTWVVPIGLDGKRRFAPVGPHGLPVATVGRWLSDSEFLLDLNTVANVNQFVFNLRIDGERVRLRMNQITGDMKNVEVEGIAIRDSN